MALEFFHIRENDVEMLEQLTELEQELNAERSAGLGVFEVSSFIKYGRVYVAVEQDEILGCVYFMRDFENSSKVYQYGINIRPDDSGRNIGFALLISAFGDLKESGIRMVEVMADASNFRALQVYREQLGFNVISAADDEYTYGDELLVLRKTL